MAKVLLENVTKIFMPSRHESLAAVRDVSIAVEQGELLALVGPSGSGKSTLLRLVAGLEEATRGTIRIDGRSANRIPPQDRGVAMVFQQPALYPHMTVGENLAFSLKIRKAPKPEIAQRVQDAAERLAIDGLLGRYPQSLSGGERQRVAVARSVVQRPQIFLFDEPLSNLDAPARLQLRREISKLHIQFRATTIYVTHDQSEAMAIGNRVAVLNHGQLEQIAEPLLLYQKPETLFVAEFVGSPPMNFFSGALETVNASEKSTAQGFIFRESPRPGERASADAFQIQLPCAAFDRVKSLAGKRVILGLRPEAMAVDMPSRAAESMARIDAAVELVEPLGPDTYLCLKTAHQTFTIRVPANCTFAVGEVIRVRFDLNDVHIFDPETRRAIR